MCGVDGGEPHVVCAYQGRTGVNLKDRWRTLVSQQQRDYNLHTAHPLNQAAPAHDGLRDNLGW